MPKLNWIWQAVLAMLSFLPFMFTVGYIKKAYDMPSQIAVLYYTIGMAIGVGLWLQFGATNVSHPNLEPRKAVALASLLITLGLFFGAAANLFIYEAVLNAPNPGLPVVFANLATVILFIGSFLMYKAYPLSYPEIEFDAFKLGGIVFIFCGIALVVLGKKVPEYLFIVLKKLQQIQF